MWISGRRRSPDGSVASSRGKGGSNVLNTPQGQAILERIKRIPIFETLGMRITAFGEGYCEAVVPHRREFDGVYGSFHGGLLMTAADSIACFAIFTQTGADQHLTTTDMSIRFLAPCQSNVVVRANVIKLGRTLCPVAVDLFDASGKKVAIAQVTYMRLDNSPKKA